MDQTQSQDNTSNAAIGGELFEELKNALKANIDDTDLSARLQASVDDMRALQGQTDFAEAYQKFVALSAGHVGVVRPFLAPLADQIGTAQSLIAMSEPLIVEIPHKLGKDEAIRRLKNGIGKAASQSGQLIAVHEEIWSGDRLSFRVESMKQMVSGTVDVKDASVRIEVVLPWLLARLANTIQGAIRKSGALMLDKKP